jgi:hypothetical protein
MATGPAKYRIHPAIGIARVGDSPDEFYIAPDQPAAKPIDCDRRGNPRLSPDGTKELPVTHFKDAQGRIKRQAARYQIYVYDDANPQGRALVLGDDVEGGGNRGKLVDITWQVYPANKKAVWYEFRGVSGEAGYAADHRLRNADIDDPRARQQLIIDPGPQIVNVTTHRRAEFSRYGNPGYAATFPPTGLWPHDIDTLGTALTDDHGRLLVLGGHGRSGTYKTGVGQPRIDNYANTDGWFDDTSDGPVMARLVMYSAEVDRLRYVDVEYPAWMVCGYPRYAPEMLDIVTMEEVVEDLAIRKFAYRTDMFGTAGSFANPQQIAAHDQEALSFWRAGKLEWNDSYRPWFWRDIWPILFRPNEFNWVSNILAASNAPHDPSSRGSFDPERLCDPPLIAAGGLRRRQEIAVGAHADGLQAVDALEPVLLRSERDAPDRHTEIGTLLDGLAAAFQRFVAAVAPPTGEPPEAYQRRWRKVFAENQQNPSPAYANANDALTETVERLIFPRPRTATLVSARRDDDTHAPMLDPNERLRDAVDRVLREFRTGKLLEAAFERTKAAATTDPGGPLRRYLYQVLRRPGEENVFRLGGNPATRTFHLPLMPLQAGDNPLYNESPSKFLRLTDRQLFLLRQWADGNFINEARAGLVPPETIKPWEPYSRAPILHGRQLDQGVLSNMLGGAFFPGGEISWIIRNPTIWYEPYQLKADPTFYTFRETAAQVNQITVTPFSYVSYASSALSLGSDYAVGLQPGDLTKMGALPWQADFNECTTQGIDVTYEAWNAIDPDNPNDPVLRREQQVWETMWWPAHRPLQVSELIDDGAGGFTTTRPLNWSRGVPQTTAGDMKMVTAWTQLSFVILNPTVDPAVINNAAPGATRFVGVERAKDNP